MVKFGNVDVDISDIGIEYNTLRVIKSRNSFIREWIEKGAKFIGKVDKDDIKEDGLKRMTKNITGDELWIEYFLFEIKSIPTIVQFRLGENIKTF